VLAILAVPFAVIALQPYGSTVEPLSPAIRESVKASGAWRRGCPVPLSQLRLLTVTHWGWDGKPTTGQLIVNREVAPRLAKVFRRLYELRFPIRHMQLDDLYGPKSARSPDGDTSGSFECRKAAPSPCGTGSGNWSNHAYGYAVDLNPAENPYVGCGMTRDPTRARYIRRNRLYKGMVTPAVVAAFHSVGWGWGGAWTGDTQDYMHFSVNGR